MPDKPTDLRRNSEIDAICDRFEAASREGQSPSIRTELGLVEEKARPELFRLLLELQLSLVGARGNLPDRDALLVEYPGYSREIAEVFAEIDSSGPGDVTMPGQSQDAVESNREILREIQPEERYRLEGEVARGGMGAIHLAEELALRRRVAVKHILNESATSDEIARFIEEAQITGQLDHPGIVPVYELGVDASGKPFYSMKFVHGRDLHAILHGIRSGDADLIAEYPLPRLLNLFDRACDAVAFAHAHGVIHRDLKPGNIRIGEFGEVLVMDWGLAKLIEKAESPASAAGETRQVTSVRGEDGSGSFHTLAGSIMGSPQYMAPEQAAGEVEGLDARTDIYALGAILYEILTLTPAIEALPDVYKTLESVTSGNIRNPILLNRAAALKRREKLVHCPGNRIPEALAKVTMKALSLKPEDRYGKVTDLQREIKAWLGGFATEAENAGFFRLIRLFVRRHKVTTAAAAIIAILLVAGSAVNLHQRNVAVIAKGDAETALADYQKSEREKAEQRRQSAPAYLKAALALEQNGDFEGALTAVEVVLTFDPELVNGHRTLAILHARAGNRNEALAAAESWLSLAPGNEDARELEALLRNDRPDSESGFYPKLASLATNAGMPSTATDCLSQSNLAYQELYRELISVWQAKLDQAWPGLPERLWIGPGWGLRLDLGSEKARNVVTSLEPLRGIPLQWLRLSKLAPLDDLTPLKDMPLRYLDFPGVQVSSLNGLQNCPLEILRLDGAALPITSDYLEPLRGKRLDLLLLGNSTQIIDTSVLAEVQCRELVLWSTNLSSLAFLRQQKDLRIFRMNSPPADRDCAPLLELPTLEQLSGTVHVISVILRPVWIDLTEGNVDSALERVKSLREQAVSPALGEVRRSLDLMRFLIERKLTGRSEIDPTTLGTVQSGPKVYVRLTYLKIGNDPPVEAQKIQQALVSIDASLASIINAEENEAARQANKNLAKTLIGGYRHVKDPAWKWRDQTPWGYTRMPKVEESRPFKQYAPWQYCILTKSGDWVSDHYGSACSGMLIQFPAAWLEAK